MEVSRHVLHERVYSVNYEDLVANPSKTISDLMCYVGLKSDEAINRFLHVAKIENRDTKDSYYFSKCLDGEVERIARYGL